MRRPPSHHLRVTLALLLLAAAGRSASVAIAADVSGQLRVWHRVEVAFDGPAHAETDDSPNPFLDYRLQCGFWGPSGQHYEVPGFFDTDGNGATQGSKWKCRFAPDQVGSWAYMASFRQGTGVATSLDAAAGSATAFDGDGGSFSVAASNKTGDDFRAPGAGMLTNAGHHYLTFRGSGRPWVKGGMNIPENLLGYVGFDNTPGAGHAFAAHVQHWQPGDPDWNGGAGRAIIGALSYIAATGGNGVYFLPMNIGGDGEDTFPTVGAQDRTHYDTSKLAQWEVVFSHADALGVFLHFVLSEAEISNANYHDGGTLGPQRKLFYRELVARFGHHLGVEWDIGEENNYSAQRHAEFAAHIAALDAYDHPITSHTRFGELEARYAPLLGNPDFAMTAFQDGLTSIDDDIEEWRERSAAAGVPWVVSFDEPHPIENDPNDDNRGYPGGRRNFLWPVYLSGGGGFEWYVKNDGGGDSFDQVIEDFAEAEVALEWTGHAREFMSRLPLLSMAPRRDLSTAGYTLAAPGQAYAMYSAGSGSISVDLTGTTEPLHVDWMDPRTGAWHDGGTVSGTGMTSIGSAPFSGDAAVMLLVDELPPVTTTLAPTTTTTLAMPSPAVCEPSPLSSCRDAATSTLTIRKNANAARDKLTWRWTGSDPIPQPDFGVPGSATTYSLCVYDSEVTAPTLAIEMVVPPNPLWTSRRGGGYRFKDRSGTFDGTQRLLLTGGGTQPPKSRFRAGRASLGLPHAARADGYFHQEGAVTVQLVTDDAACWSSTFAEAQRNTADRYKASSP